MTRKEFINKAWEAAVAARSRGAVFSIPIAVAQAALETNYNKSTLSKEHNNLFGIKGDYKGEYTLLPTREQNDDGSWITVDARFRSYPSWTECFEDYAGIIERLPWYQDAYDASHSPRDFLKGLIVIRDDNGNLVEPGWATDKNYFNKVWSIAEEWDLLDRQEINERDKLDLLIIYDGDRKLVLEPVKHTLGRTSDGNPKLMVRTKETTFLDRLRYLFS